MNTFLCGRNLYTNLRRYIIRKSSRVRRREQRKKERGKKGTIYEEEYLVKSIKKLCEKATTMQSKYWHYDFGIIANRAII